MRNYRVIGKRAEFEATDDRVAAVAVATAGDLGFRDRYKLDKFPAAWTEDEFASFLGAPLSEFQVAHKDEIAAAVAAIKS